MFASKSGASTASSQGSIESSQSSKQPRNRCSAQASTNVTLDLNDLTRPSRPSQVDLSESPPKAAVPPQTGKSSAKTETAADEKKSKDPAFKPSLFVRDLKEGTLEIAHTVMNFARDKKRSPTFRILTIGGTIAAVAVSAAHSVTAGLGALAFVVCRLGATITENRLVRPQGAVQGGVLSAHFAADHNQAFATSSAVVCVRMLIQSMIPESRTVMHGAVATVGITLSCAMFCCAPGFLPGFTFANAPLLAIAAWGITGALPSKYSAITRLTSVAMNTLMLPYHCFVSGSMFLAALCLVGGHAHAKKFMEKDLPELRKNKWKFSNSKE